MVPDKNNTDKREGQGEAKRSLRRRMLERRAGMAPEERERASRAATAHITATPAFQNAERVAVFLSFGDEIDTWGIVAAAWRLGKEVWAPKVDEKARVLRWGRVRGRDDLVPGPYRGILEPEQAVAADAVRPDLVIVPGLAFDGEGYRLGYGGGYYDRCLAGWPGAARYGYAFAWQRVDRVPREHHDVPVDALVTDAGVEHFRSPGPRPVCGR